jgi:hypothetical protein
MLRVRVRYEDEESRTALKKAGFRWNPQRKLWEGPDTLANRELLDRLGLVPEAMLAPAADHEPERQDKQAADLLGEYIYSFSREGRRVVGISWAGAKRLAQKYLPGLEVELVRVDTTDKWIAVVVKAKTERGSALGAAQVPASERFAYTIAINKAQRNAIMNLLDEAVIKHALEEYLQDSRLSRSS